MLTQVLLLIIRRSCHFAYNFGRSYPTSSGVNWTSCGIRNDVHASFDTQKIILVVSYSTTSVLRLMDKLSKKSQQIKLR